MQLHVSQHADEACRDHRAEAPQADCPQAAAHLTYLLKSGCTKVRCGHSRFPM